MTFKVYDKQTKESLPVKVSDEATLMNLAFVIGNKFGLDMFGHAFLFSTNLRNEYKDKVFTGSSADGDDENEEVLIKCSEVFAEVGHKLLFIQDLGDCNRFIVTRKE